MKYAFGMLGILVAGLCASAIQAEELRAPSDAHSALLDFSARRDIRLVPPLTAAMAVPRADPQPAPAAVSDEDSRWETSVGFAVTRFRSKPFSKTLYGAESSFTYFFNDYFGLEGNLGCGSGHLETLDERASLIVYSAGTHLAWRDQRKAIQPWAHVLGGSVLVYPQTAAGGVRAIAMQMGGGVDVRVAPRISVRVQVDWLRSWLYSSTQHNAMAVLGVVIHP
jgi:hypothetical protein